MIETISLRPGITLRCFRDTRFKQGCMSFQLIRRMDAAEAHLNALLPAVLIRGTKNHPNLRAITHHLDELYGATVSTLVRRVGDYQTVGLYCGFMDDRFALEDEQVLEGMTAFLEELLLDSRLEDGCFPEEVVRSEKQNLIAAIESELNDKRAYAMARLMKLMCKGDSFGLPRLGEKEKVAQISARELYSHYLQILRESPVEIFYVGSADSGRIAALLKPLADKLGECYVNLPAQTAFSDGGGGDHVEVMDVAQGKLCMGFTTTITNRDPEFPAMQLLNTIFGGGMTSKLFVNVREKLSLCYSVGSGYHGSKGIMLVSAGIDFDKEQQTRREILRQLGACRNGSISARELSAAKEALLSSLRATHDSPGSIEGYYATAALSGMGMTPEEYMAALEAVTLEQVVAAANRVRLHSSYFLKGVD